MIPSPPTNLTLTHFMVQELLMGQRKSQVSDFVRSQMKNVTCKHGFNQLIDHAISANMEKYGEKKSMEK